MAIQEQQWNEVLLKYGQNQATLLAKKKALLGRRQLKEEAVSRPKKSPCSRKDLGNV